MPKQAPIKTELDYYVKKVTPIPKRVLYVHVPAPLYVTAQKLAMKEGISMTALIVCYFRYLQRMKYKDRKPLYETSEPKFILNRGADTVVPRGACVEQVEENDTGLRE